MLNVSRVKYKFSGVKLENCSRCVSTVFIEHRFLVDLIKPPSSVLRLDTPVQLFVRGSTLCLASCTGNGSGPPRHLASWMVRDLRRYGILEGKFCFEVASDEGWSSCLFVCCC